MVMKVGIDACCWANQRGFGRFTRELLTALLAADQKNEYLFFVDEATGASASFPASARVVLTPTREAPTRAASASGRRSVRDVAAFSRAVMRHDVDVFLFPASYTYFPILNRTKILVTLHDLIADHHPDLTFPSTRLKLFWKLKQNLAVRQASLLLTVSEYSKSRIAEFYGVDASRIRVVPEAAHPIFRQIPRDAAMDGVLARYGLGPGERFVLYVGGMSPHKNLSALVEAFSRIVELPGESDVRLVLVGDYRGDSFFSEYTDLKARIERLGLDRRVTFAGFVEDEELVALYNAASVFVLPSLEEGFGLPVVEAMACGAPVVSSDRGSLPEVLGPAGRLFDPADVAALAAALSEVLRDPELRERMRAAGLVRAAALSWGASASRLIEILDDVGPVARR